MSRGGWSACDYGGTPAFPEDAAAGSFDREWHRVAVDYALQNVSTVTDTDSVLAALG